ncbi:MAG: hypothetical protein ACREH9_00095 [Pseudomonadota bacterium]
MTAAILAIVFAQACSAAARKKHPVAMRSAAGTVIQPTRTIIHNPDGTTTIIVTPRRSYLDPGTESSPGDGKNRDYILPPDGDPGRPSAIWFYGPDATGAGGYPLPRPFYLPGFNPDTPF